MEKKTPTWISVVLVIAILLVAFIIGYNFPTILEYFEDEEASINQIEVQTQYEYLPNYILNVSFETNTEVEIKCINPEGVELEYELWGSPLGKEYFSEDGAAVFELTSAGGLKTGEYTVEILTDDGEKLDSKDYLLEKPDIELIGVEKTEEYYPEQDTPNKFVTIENFAIKNEGDVPYALANVELELNGQTMGALDSESDTILDPNSEGTFSLILSVFEEVPEGKNLLEIRINQNEDAIDTDDYFSDTFVTEIEVNYE